MTEFNYLSEAHNLEEVGANMRRNFSRTVRTRDEDYTVKHLALLARAVLYVCSSSLMLPPSAMYR